MFFPCSHIPSFFVAVFFFCPLTNEWANHCCVESKSFFVSWIFFTELSWHGTENLTVAIRRCQ
jgi:hypothetical protein